MAIASPFEAYLAYVAESTPGTTPGTPSMLKLRTTDVKQINGQKELLESEEVYSHRQLISSRHGFKSVAGSIPFELSYGAFDDWLEALLGGVWTSEVAGTPNTLKIGNTIYTFTVERGWPNISEYEVFRGVIPNALTLDITPSGLVTGSFDIIGMDFDAAAATALGAPADVATDSPLVGLGNASLQEGGGAIAIVTSISMQIENNRAIGRVVGSDGGTAPVNGSVSVTGTLTAQFEDETLLNKFINETSSSLQIVLNNEDASQSLTFDFHNIKYNGAAKEENNNALDLSLPFIATYDVANSTALTVTRSNNA